MLERLNHPLATDELVRRWRLTREAMTSENIDVLLVQARTSEAGGYVRWLIDFPANFIPVTVIFPREGGMTVIMHGNLNGEAVLGPQGNDMLRGVERVLTTASFPSVVYTREHEAELIVRELQAYGRARVGLLSAAQISLAAGERIKRDLPQCTFVDADEFIDPIKALKSPYEQDLIRETARLQDSVMQTTLDAVEPGKRESDIIAVARRAAYELGSEAGVYMLGSGPLGSPTPLAPSHLQHRILNEGDILTILIEVDGPGGLYTELGRTCVIGEASQELLEEHEFAARAQQATVNLLRPGALCSEVWREYNGLMRDSGRPEERRLHAHGQGHDLVERPLIRFDETMQVQPGMNFACHPYYEHLGVMWWLCDNWLIGPDGPTERLHAFPQRIVEL